MRPLDTLNRPVDHTATLTVRNVGVDSGQPQRVQQLRAWTSTDHGASWQPASVTRTSPRRFDLTLPDVPPGTAVSLRVDASDRHESRIEQTLIDAYVA